MSRCARASPNQRKGAGWKDRVSLFAPMKPFRRDLHKVNNTRGAKRLHCIGHETNDSKSHQHVLLGETCSTAFVVNLEIVSVTPVGPYRNLPAIREISSRPIKANHNLFSWGRNAHRGALADSRLPLRPLQLGIHRKFPVSLPRGLTTRENCTEKKKNNRRQTSEKKCMGRQRYAVNRQIGAK